MTLCLGWGSSGISWLSSVNPKLYLTPRGLPAKTTPTAVLWSARHKNYPARDLPGSKVFEDFVDLRERPRRGLAPDLSSSGQCQDFPQVFPRSDRRRLDAYLSRSHQDGGKAQGLGWQADDEENAGWPDARKGCVIGLSGCGSNHRDVSSPRTPQFFHSIQLRRVQRGRCAQAFSARKFFVRHIYGCDGRAQTQPYLYSQMAQPADSEHRQTLPWL